MNDDTTTTQSASTAPSTETLIDRAIADLAKAEELVDRAPTAQELNTAADAAAATAESYRQATGSDGIWSLNR